MNSNLAVAKEIIRQLGGQRFVAMTGAKNFTGGDRHVSFQLPRFAGVTVNAVHIELGGDDLYAMRFLRVAGSKVSEIKKVDSVYCDALASTFSDVTGLATGL